MVLWVPLAAVAVTMAASAVADAQGHRRVAWLVWGGTVVAFGVGAVLFGTRPGDGLVAGVWGFLCAVYGWLWWRERGAWG